MIGKTFGHYRIVEKTGGRGVGVAYAGRPPSFPVLLPCNYDQPFSQSGLVVSTEVSR